MKNYTIIGIVGNHGSGKSTLADWLATQFSEFYPTVRLNFADFLREQLSSILPKPLTRNKTHPYEREALVFVGELWREKDPDFFIKKYYETLNKKLHSTEHTVVITDDVYHFNERNICDIVLYIRNPNYHIPKGYVPVSVKETFFMLDTAKDVITISKPEDLNYEAIFNRLLEETNQRRYQ